MGTDGTRSLQSIDELHEAVNHCRRCPLWRHATQGVPGEGDPRARIMLVGEQPGDAEDLQGHPFVGPAGALLDRALAEAGFERDELWITNAVKHFKYEQRGKRRLPHPLHDALLWVTIHPSYLLRIREDADRRAEYQRFVGELRDVKAAARRTAPRAQPPGRRAAVPSVRSGA